MDNGDPDLPLPAVRATRAGCTVAYTTLDRDAAVGVSNVCAASIVRVTTKERPGGRVIAVLLVLVELWTAAPSMLEHTGWNPFMGLKALLARGLGPAKCVSTRLECCDLSV